MRVCAITNVYNESFNLPIWLKHYGAQVGEQNCLIIDNGSTDGSTSSIGLAGRIHMPRKAFSDHVRAKFISDIANSLLTTYDAVLYSDCDELLVADPAKHRDLATFCELLDAPCATAIGLNVFQHIEHESALRMDTDILQQREYVQFVSPMCKSLVIREKVSWGHGFHSCSLKPIFSDLYLFHLRWVDLSECLRRLAITQKVEFAHDANHHHSSIRQFVKYYDDFSKRLVTEDFDFDVFLRRLLSDLTISENNHFSVSSDIRSETAIRIPTRFRSIF